MKHQSEALNVDCMDYMRTLPDGYFDLAVVDPPYGGANSDVGGGTGLAVGLTDTKRVARTGGTWATKYGKKL